MHLNNMKGVKGGGHQRREHPVWCPASRNRARNTLHKIIHLARNPNLKLILNQRTRVQINLK